MNAWLESLQSLLDKETLEQFDEIYYLGSTQVVESSNLEKLFKDENSKAFLVKNLSDVNEDLLDYFLLVNEERQDVLVVFSPFELIENESIYLRIENIQEDFSDLPEIEAVK